MSEGFDRDELLGVPEIARYLKVSEVTVYRWCKEGKLPCLKLGHTWRVRRSALVDFLQRGERSATLFGLLRSFYRAPDNVLAIAHTEEMLHDLDAAFFGVGEARGDTLAKFIGPRTEASADELRDEMARRGLDVRRLEDEEGRLSFVDEGSDDHLEALRRYLEEAEFDRRLWAAFDWAVGVDPEVAVERQRKVTRLSAQRVLVVQTGVLEGGADEWPPPLGREAQLAHTATVWFSREGLATTRIAPVATR